MKLMRLLVAFLTMCGAMYMNELRADDIDIYVANSGTTGVPNVLFVYDNAASFDASTTNTCTYTDSGTAPSLGNTAGGVQQCALYNTIYGLAPDTVNIGLMIYNENSRTDYKGTACGNNANGGCLVVPLSNMSTTTKAQILDWIKGWSATGSDGPLTNGVIKPYVIKGNTQRTGAVMQEAWAYYSGNTGLSGRNYSSIQPPAGCQRNFLVFVGNAFRNNTTPGDGGSANILQSLTNAGATSAQTAAITIPSGSYGASNFTCGSYSMPSHSDSSGLYADEWARFMKQTDIYGGTGGNQGITSYTIGLLGSSCNPQYPALLTSMAKYGGGKYFATSNYDELKVAIQKILNEVQAVNSVFASATLPVSVNAQGTYLNQIYLGMFRPDPYALPRWVGNLKQYQFALSYPDPTNPDPNKASLILADAQDPPQPAISSAGTGFIAPDAVSFWTYLDAANAPDDTTTGGFYKNDPRGAGGVYDKADGEQVDKGGVGQQVRKQVLKTNYTTTPAGPRKVYTYCPSGASCNGNLTNVTANEFTTNNAAISDALLNSQSSVAVTSLTRSGTTATVNTSAAHGFAVGDSIRIAGADQNEYNGTQAVLAVGSSTSFTFTTVEYPPAAASGSYTVSKPTTPKSVTSLTRSGGTVTVTSAAHGFSNGNSITISGASPAEYNGTFTIANVTANTFTYSVTETPKSPAGGGTATVGSTVRNIEAWNSNPNPGVERVTGSTTVTITTTANHGFSNTGTVTLSNIADSSGTTITTYTGSFAYTKTGNKTFTITLPASALGPTTPATGTITADLTTTRTISSLSRSGSTATAVTTVAHGFAVNDLVDVGGTVGTNESAYAGTKTILSVPSTTSFTYAVTVTPATPATGTITASKFGTTDRTSLINWVRGEDNYGDEPGPGSGVTVRPSVHGDVLHSRPVVINYGDSTRGTVVFYGSNDGQFRAINGSQATALTNWDGTTVPAGGELWSLVLAEHYSKLARLRVNTPELKFPTTQLATAQPKDYFVDGPTGVYQLLNADGSINKAILYLTMRRGNATDGSRFLYAVDVSTPTQPVVLWRKASGDSGFSGLGQTWSRPRVTLLQGYRNTGTDTTIALGNSGSVTIRANDYIPVLVFGGGYDPNQDTDPPSTADTMGRAVYFVHALTGALIHRFEPTCANPTGTCTAVSGLNYAIPSELTFVDRDNNGLTDKMYVGDLGGNVWRLDVADATPSNWTMQRFAALGCDTGAPSGSPATKCTQEASLVGGVATVTALATAKAPRKFFFPPSVVMVGGTGAAGSYDAVLLGSGDREHPLYISAASTVQNRLFFLKDAGTAVGGAGATTGVAAFTAGATLASTNLVNASSFGTSTTYDGSLSGYYINLSSAEKSVNAPVTVYGATYFGTNTPSTPSSTQCSANLGTARSYALNPFTGQFNTNVFDGGGMPPSPVAGLVTLKYRDGNNVEQSLLRKFCIGCAGSPPVAGGTPPASCNSALQNCLPDQTISGSVKRTYWYTK
ncbi:hypothetical protein RQP54_07190 [Curvibacter sp. APW13]|uniref:hypothetical protein n=1 Tax=Curvibacter sp. APW13 TaxID=3077236 RepID=UPI0028DF4005|nr:hypothetical protein [Curvibacter sp. APW13]MDT8990649.1 hypothetical protein [Curvibacter sp. APW13]